MSAPGAVAGAAVSVGVGAGEAPTAVGDVPAVGVAVTAIPVVGVEVAVEVEGADGVGVCDGVGSEPIGAETWGVKKTSTK